MEHAGRPNGPNLPLEEGGMRNAKTPDFLLRASLARRQHADLRVKVLSRDDVQALRVSDPPPRLL